MRIAKKEYWRDELRDISTPSDTYFMNDFSQNEIIAIERFIENLLEQQREEIVEEIEKAKETSLKTKFGKESVFYRVACKDIINNIK